MGPAKPLLAAARSSRLVPVLTSVPIPLTAPASRWVTSWPAKVNVPSWISVAPVCSVGPAMVALPAPYFATDEAAVLSASAALTVRALPEALFSARVPPGVSGASAPSPTLNPSFSAAWPLVMPTL
ncbi:MAG: hypothetical protein BWX70_02241 [Verrucomicrobia bacterium ADurb.Bin070]|nr:MAG: hypothetical protein BWX70_02241 [Verrucomicrobia bacterium ADurb.Bin070]